MHLPVADAGVTALSFFDVAGAAVAVGERPLLSIQSPEAMVRTSLGEALTNMAGVPLGPGGRYDIKCSANWMWPAAGSSEAAALHDAVAALSECMVGLGVAVDGGKDSLSMEVRMQKPSGPSGPGVAGAAGGAGDGSGSEEADFETVKGAGTLVVTAYAPCADVTKTVTPDLKVPHRNGPKGGTGAGSGRRGAIILVDVAAGRRRMGGSSLAATLGKPDLWPVPDLVGSDEGRCEGEGEGEGEGQAEGAEGASSLLGAGFDVIQRLVSDQMISAIHDVSDGGALVSLVEMGLAGDVGFSVDLPLPSGNTPSEGGDGKAGGEGAGGEGGAVMLPHEAAALFSEELGWFIEVDPLGETPLDPNGSSNGSSGSSRVESVLAAFSDAGVPAYLVGESRHERSLSVSVGGRPLLDAPLSLVRMWWETTSLRLDRLQAAPACVYDDALTMRRGGIPRWRLPADPMRLLRSRQLNLNRDRTTAPRVAVVREEGSNGDRELAAALYASGFQVIDLTMRDLIGFGSSSNAYRLDAHFAGVAFGEFPQGSATRSDPPQAPPHRSPHRRHLHLGAPLSTLTRPRHAHTRTRL